jgi:hypothetical protein
MADSQVKQNNQSAPQQRQRTALGHRAAGGRSVSRGRGHIRLYYSAVRRFLTPTVLNLLVPGSGLVALGRVWTGLALTAWYVLGVELALVGWLIAPATIPNWLRWTGVGFSAATWTLGQGLLFARIRYLRSEDLPRQLAILRRLAEHAMARRDYRTAGAALSVGLSLDDTSIAIHALRARLANLTGRTRTARRLYRGVLQMEGHEPYIDEAQRAMHPHDID